MKITLMDIMESLNGDNVEDAQAALHEWFVEQSKAVHRNIVDPVEESEEDDDLDDAYDRELPRTGDKVVIDERPGTIGEVVDHDLYGGPATFKVHYDDGTTGVHSVDSIESGSSEYDEVDEGRVDELSRDTQMAYAKKARKYRDQPNADDEKVGRRVVGLDMVANKARKERAALQYESAGSPTLVFVEDPNDGYDELWAFETPEDASSFIQYYQALFAGSIYGNMDLARVVSAEEYADVDLPQPAPAGCFNEMMSVNDFDGSDDPDDEDYDDLDDDLDDEEEDEAFEQWRSDHFDAHAIYAPSEDEDEDEVEESTDMESLIAELQESFAGLETVSDKLQNVEGAQVGEEGKVPVNTKSTLPSKKGDKRVGGEAVEIKSKDHKGHALEKAPKVKDAPVKHHIQNSKDDPKKVTAEKSALLNKMDGSVNTQSPISGKGAKGLKK